MKNILAIGFGAVLIVAGAPSGRATTLVEFGMTGASPTQLETATTVDASLTASLITANASTVSLTPVGTSPNEVLNVAMASGTPLSTLNEATTITGGTYISFTLTPTAGESLSLTSLTFKAEASNGSTPRAFYVFSSINGSSSVATTLLTDNNGTGGTLGTSLTSYTIDLSGSQYQNLTSAFTFKFYVQTPSLGQSVSFDDFLVSGIAVAAVPEPGTTLLLLLSGGAMMVAGGNRFLRARFKLV